MPEPEAPSSTKTATARSPWAATIHAWVRVLPPFSNSAVPVLAIAGGPGRSSSPRPLPEVTTPRSIDVSAASSAAVRGFASSGTETSTDWMSLGTTVWPAWIEDITVAIAIGEASTVP